MYTIIKRKESI